MSIRRIYKIESVTLNGKDITNSFSHTEMNYRREDGFADVRILFTNKSPIDMIRADITVDEENDWLIYSYFNEKDKIVIKSYPLNP